MDNFIIFFFEIKCINTYSKTDSIEIGIFEFDFGVFGSHVTGALQESSIGLSHNIGLNISLINEFLFFGIL